MNGVLKPDEIGHIDDNPLAPMLVEVDKDTAVSLMDTFSPLLEKANEWKVEAEKIIITNIDQADDMKKARKIRLAMKSVRGDVEKDRVKMKKNIVLMGKAIDGISNIIKAILIPAEDHLKEQELFIQRKEERRKADLADKRGTELYQYDIDPSFYSLDVMPEEGYVQLLEASKISFDNKKAAELKIEQDRIAKETAEAEERELVSKENEQLRKDAVAREKKIKVERQKQAKIEKERQAKENAARKAREEKERKEREEQQAKLTKEREAREKVEAELKARNDAEEKAALDEQARLEAEEKAREDAENAARLAPDKKKLEDFAVRITKVETPDVTSEEAKAIVKGAVELLNRTSAYIKDKSCNL